MATATATAIGERPRQRAHGRSTRHWLAEESIQSVAREVEVTRRLYRSGESEYLIDGQVCRLRDIHDLLMDTGLGAKAYAIIEQGKIGMILSTRPTDRRQLIEEAAGVTKYKARRRAAELKLEAAQQNLTRIDDIVFEVEKQRGTLKRQAAKARRYQKLRDELRRWEKVLFARKYRQLAETIESARARLADAREREVGCGGAASPRSKSDLGRVRIELAEAESRGHGRARGGARARAGDQPPAAADRVRSANRCRRSSAPDRAWRRRFERSTRGASRRACARRRGARPRPTRSAERDRAAAALAAESEAYETAHREIEGLEADVEAARSEVFSAINSATALRHALEHAAAARDRVAETLVEAGRRGRRRPHRVGARRRPIGRPRPTACAARTRRSRRRAIAGAARESELASARIEHEWRARVGSRARARARRPRGAAEVARGARRRPRRLRRCRAHRAGAGQRQGRISRARSPTTSRSRPATSAPSRPASAICSSTSSSSGPSTRRPDSSSCAKRAPAAADSWLRRRRPAESRGHAAPTALRVRRRRPALVGRPAGFMRCRPSCASTAPSPARFARRSATPGSRRPTSGAADASR